MDYMLIVIWFLLAVPRGKLRNNEQQWKRKGGNRKEIWVAQGELMERGKHSMIWLNRVRDREILNREDVWQERGPQGSCGKSGMRRGSTVPADGLSSSSGTSLAFEALGLGFQSEAGATPFTPPQPPEGTREDLANPSCCRPAFGQPPSALLRGADTGNHSPDSSTSWKTLFLESRLCHWATVLLRLRAVTSRSDSNTLSDENEVYKREVIL